MDTVLESGVILQVLGLGIAFFDLAVGVAGLALQTRAKDNPGRREDEPGPTK